MRKVNLNWALTIKMSESQRKAIEKLADHENTTLGEAARTVLSRGFEAMAIPA
jgi:hypothetical protein